MIETHRRARLAVRLSNWLLRTFAPNYAKFIGGSAEYGMRAAAEDAKTGRDYPPDWRPGGRTFEARDEEAIALLKSDPDKFFERRKP